ncbi:ABC transporter substrate-binding protein [Embleya sp. NBC_00896]|uniref:ABC transporter substrate-binding protein n=1 Tax=Embleya sp. NBC_00896 TaxID=2975961 RepID=UPI00386CC4FE|nr:ABC transporter substrate-binding protein [Embleya sp. NBC_00896]
MSGRLTHRRLIAITAAIVSGAMLMTACGDDKDSALGKKDENAPFFKMLPPDVQKSGKIEIGSEIAYAPIEFMEKGKAVGVDPDLAAALSKQLGVKYDYKNSPFDALITGVTSNRFDIVMSAMTDKKERQNQGLSFVDYFKAGTSILVKKGNPENIKSLDDLCGKTVALQEATVNEDVAVAQSAKCKENGKGEITIQKYANDGEALLKIKGGGAVADLNDFPVAAYNAQTSGGGNDFEVTGDQINAGLYGIGVGKDNTQLQQALKSALEALIKNGEYGKIMDKWKVQAGAVTEVTINGATS